MKNRGGGCGCGGGGNKFKITKTNKIYKLCLV